jgi:hypothetical protein
MLFADDLAFSSLTINGLQKAIDQVTVEKGTLNVT